jgi:hypothetical protein
MVFWLDNMVCGMSILWIGRNAPGLAHFLFGGGMA